MHKHVIGLGFMQAWLWLFFLSGPLFLRVMINNKDLCIQIFVAFIFFNALSYLLSGSWFKDFFQEPARHYFLLSCGLLCAGATLVIGLGGAYDCQTVYLLMAAGLAGLGSAPLICALGEVFSRHSLDKVGLHYGLACVWGTVLFFGFNFLPVWPAVILTALLPLLVSYCLLSISEKPSASRDYSSSVYVPASSGWFMVPGKIVLLIVLFYLACGLMQHTVLLSDCDCENLFYWVGNLTYCLVVLIAGFGIARNPHLHMRLVYLPALPLVGTGFLFIAVLGIPALTFSFILLEMGFALFNVYIWMFFTALAARNYAEADPELGAPIAVFGQGFFIVTASMFVGTHVMSFVYPLLSGLDGKIYIVALAGAMVMFLATGLFHRFGDIEWHETTADVRMDSPDSVPLAACMEIAAEENAADEKYMMPEISAGTDNRSLIEPQQLADNYELTRRESEILELLLKGYNNPNICEKLTISQNTLKTHLRNIYRKTSVSNRQELIELYHNGVRP